MTERGQRPKAFSPSACVDVIGCNLWDRDESGSFMCYMEVCPHADEHRRLGRAKEMTQPADAEKVPETLEQWLARMEAVCEAATAEPWAAVLGSGIHVCTTLVHWYPGTDVNAFVADFAPEHAIKKGRDGTPWRRGDHWPDMAFATTARTELPKLVKAVRDALCLLWGAHDDLDGQPLPFFPDNWNDTFAEDIRKIEQTLCGEGEPDA